MSNLKLTIVSTATGIYFDYWANLAMSAQKFFESEEVNLRFFLFTDRTDDAHEFGQTLDWASIKVQSVVARPWPWATMARYADLAKHSESVISESDFILHVDADMTFEAPFPESVLAAARKSGVLLVQHPGFFRKERGPEEYVRNIFSGARARDFLERIKVGGVGAWESSPKSRAFVPRIGRKRYFCGGVWICTGDNLRAFSEDLAARIDIDYQNGVTAVWHDESHLNAWAFENPKRFAALGPEFCFAPQYTELSHLQPVIQVVEKGLNRSR